MEFCPLNLCKKLEALGCKSESEYYCTAENVYMTDFELEPMEQEGLLKIEDEISAFIYQDFIGPSEQSKKNAELVWPDDIYEPMDGNTSLHTEWEERRHDLIELPESEFWKYIEDSIDKGRE